MQFFARFKLFFVAFWLILFCTACRTEKTAVRIAVASNLYQGIQSFVSHNRLQAVAGCKPASIQVIPGASSTLALQILNGAPFDVFISADETIAQGLAQKNKTEDPHYFATGSVAYWNRDHKTRNLKELVVHLGQGKTVIANPATAPFGARAKAIIQELYPEAKTVHAPSVQQTVALVKTGGIRSAFIAVSMLTEETFKDGHHYYRADESWQVDQTISQVRIKNGSCQAQYSQKLYELLISRAPNYLKSFGYSAN